MKKVGNFIVGIFIYLWVVELFIYFVVDGSTSHHQFAMFVIKESGKFAFALFLPLFAIEFPQ